MGKKAQRRRDKSLAEHVVHNQIEPQLTAERLRERGINVEIGFVSTNPNADGFTVTCEGCGKTAKLPTDPGTKVGLCPRCVRARGL